MRGLFFTIAVVAFFAFLAAYALDFRAQRIEWKRRAMLAAVIGASVPLSLATAALWFNAGNNIDWMPVFIRVPVLGIGLTAFVGFPVAYLFTRRCERSREPDIFK